MRFNHATVILVTANALGNFQTLTILIICKAFAPKTYNAMNTQIIVTDQYLQFHSVVVPIQFLGTFILPIHCLFALTAPGAIPDTADAGTTELATF